MPDPTPSCSPQDRDRRRLLALGLVAGAAALIPGCARPNRRSTGVSPNWPGLERPADRPAVADRPAYQPAQPIPADPTPTPSMSVLPRSAWATGDPIPARMNRLTGVSRITVHHDGMAPAQLASSRDAAGRIDLIRRAHQSEGWGDIGYHFIIDPFGQVWQGRPLAYQGAHVRDNNPGNLGILNLGNFEHQRPTNPQLATLELFLADRMRAYRVPLNAVRTHRELTPTLCPGRNMQAAMNHLRSVSPTLARA